MAWNEFIADLKLFKKTFKRPIETIAQHKIEFVIWFTFVIFAGQLGTIVNFITRCYFTNLDYRVSLYVDSLSGNFYTYSLVLIASLIGPIFIKLIKPDKLQFRRLVMMFTTLLIIVLLFNAVFFSVATKGVIDPYITFDPSLLKVDKTQLAFFCVSILFAIYAFGVERMPLHDENKDIADECYKAEDNKHVQELSEASSSDPANLDFKV